MSKYKLLVNGTNFLISTDGKLKKCGFYRNCFIEAASPKEAEDKAMQELRSDAALKSLVKNEKSDPPVMFVKECTELEAFDKAVSRKQGLAWYDE